MHNFPYAQLPQKWEDFWGQEGAYFRAKQFLLDEPAQSIFISGPSGTGKTAFTLLLIKSYRCTNRKPNEMNPCGYCETCKDHEVRLAESTLNDVFWLQPGSSNVEKTLQSSVKEALLAAQKGHTFTGDKNDILFIVFDEFHKFRDVKQDMLFGADVSNPKTKVCYIFLTMSMEDLGETEQIAFQRRGWYIPFRPHTEEEVFLYLKSKFPNCPENTAVVIAKSSKRSIGLALSLYDTIHSADPEMDYQIACLLLSYANNAQREEIWKYIKNRAKFTELRVLLDSVCKYVNSERLATQLIDDILNTADLEGDFTNQQNVALTLLNQMRENGSSTHPIQYLCQLYKLNNLVTKEGIDMTSDYLPRYSINPKF